MKRKPKSSYIMFSYDYQIFDQIRYLVQLIVGFQYLGQYHCNNFFEISVRSGIYFIFYEQAQFSLFFSDASWNPYPDHLPCALQKYLFLVFCFSVAAFEFISLVHIQLHICKSLFCTTPSFKKSRICRNKFEFSN